MEERSGTPSDDRIIELFEEAVIDFLKYFYNSEVPQFKKEEFVRCLIFSNVFKKLEKEDLLLTKKNLFTIQAEPFYPSSKRKELDLAIMSQNFDHLNERGKWKESSELQYLVACEVKALQNSPELLAKDITKLAKIIMDKKAERVYFILVDEGTNYMFLKNWYNLNGFLDKVNELISNSENLHIFYSFVPDIGWEKDSFEIKKINNITVLTKRDLLNKLNNFSRF